MYVNQNGNGNGNGKKPLGLLGEIATDFLGATIPNPLIASAFRVVSRKAAASGSPYMMPQAKPVPVPVPVAPRSLPGIYGVLQRKLDAQRAAPKPSINVVTLPNGTAVPGAIIPSNGNGGAPTQPVWYSASDGSPGAQGGGGGGGSFGPPEEPPVEVGTLPGDGSGASTGPSLAGLGPNSPILLLAAVAAFFLLGDKKRKRRR